jgi:hypothetical protein
VIADHYEASGKEEPLAQVLCDLFRAYLLWTEDAKVLAAGGVKQLFSYFLVRLQTFRLPLA